MTMKQDKLISIIAPVHNGEKLIEDFVANTLKLAKANYEQFEMIIVDDGSKDGTQEQMYKLLAEHDALRYIRLSRHSGNEVAMTAGLEAAIGDFCVVLIPGVDPIELIPQFIDQCEKSNAVVIGQMKNPNNVSLLFRVCRKIFYSICKNILGIEIPKSSTYFAAFNRNALNQIIRIKDKFRFMSALTAQIGLPTLFLPYDFIPSQKQERLRSFWSSVNISIDLMVMNSMRPLRIVSLGSLAISFLNLAYLVYILAIFFFKKDVAPGWVTVSSQTSVGFFLVFLTLAVLSEYLGRVLQESKSQPLYYVVDDKTSLMKIANHQKKNFFAESIDPKADQ